ncbi:hypothetical protein K435DRAFT_859865 [Dendrothele bispora CBS 962.96]|uniref:Uncharacterized protein n=1 Tax=Dendrothele bispora (strain CBS 962.96) TaxID=1314807 RepID=A0A4S8LZJ0_DENBC|nr:hypothetical protein K435DRAFT_859865 [Dendrothele bispora CBS 962.96]
MIPNPIIPNPVPIRPKQVEAQKREQEGREGEEGRGFLAINMLDTSKSRWVDEPGRLEKTKRRINVVARQGWYMFCLANAQSQAVKSERYRERGRQGTQTGNIGTRERRR